MDKYYTTHEYKVSQARMFRRDERRQKNRKAYLAEIRKEGKKINRITNSGDVKDPVIATDDLRLIDNPEECLLFFRNLRSEENTSFRRNMKFVIMSLKHVTKIDYATISVLTAISDDLKANGIILKGDFPDDPDCKQFIIDSGFLNHMFEERTGRPFKKVETSDLIFFEKGCGKLSEKDNMNISSTIKHVVQHLTGEINQCKAVKTVVLEICGNSIEWGGTINKQWLLGVKYEEGKAIFTVTDVGKGILETLHRKFSLTLADIFTAKSKDEILKGAFDQKYGSSTQEVNRNKGLPAVKDNFQRGVIQHLKVLTNNVILHFDNDKNSKTLKKGSARFKGTFYQWEMTKECLLKLISK